MLGSDLFRIEKEIKRRYSEVSETPRNTFFDDLNFQVIFQGNLAKSFQGKNYRTEHHSTSFEC